MKILMVNKFLYPRGGAETYLLKAGRELEQMGHKVQYFGMFDEKNVVGNRLGLSTTNMDFRKKSLSQLAYPAKILYSTEARKKMGSVLDDFQPDIVHLNNIHFHLTPSIIEACRMRNLPVVWTVHDYQLICPNHLMYADRICEACVGKCALPCIGKRCIHGSLAKSVMGAAEAELYKRKDLYQYVAAYICPSRFLQEKLSANPQIRRRVFLQNFTDLPETAMADDGQKRDYVLYFGRLSEEKGIRSLIQACKELPWVKFKIAGSGPCEDLIKEIPNVDFVGFQTGEALHSLIRHAMFTVYPSVWYENCPLSILESIQMGVPVIARDLGGMTELIDDGNTGLLAKDDREFTSQVYELYNSPWLLDLMREQCRQAKFLSLPEYCEKLVEVYREAISDHAYRRKK